MSALTCVSMPEEDALLTAVAFTSVYWESVIADCEYDGQGGVEIGGYELGTTEEVALYVHLMECVNGEGV